MGSVQAMTAAMSDRDVLDTDDSHEDIVQLSAEAQEAAARAAQAAGMPVSDWLSQLIKYAGNMEEQRRDHAEADDTAGPGNGTTAWVTDRNARAARAKPVMVPVAAIRPNALKAAALEDEQEIQTYLGAYQETGKFPPITVRRIERRMGEIASLEIVAGEQRWRAVLRARLRDAPVFIQDCSDADALIFSVREAKRHYRLAPLVEARCYVRLMKSCDLSASEIAAAVGESNDHVVDMLNLLALPRAVQKMVEDGVLSQLHARALLQADDPETIAWEVAGRGLDIFQTEQMVRTANARAEAGE